MEIPALDILLILKKKIADHFWIIGIEQCISRSDVNKDSLHASLQMATGEYKCDAQRNQIKALIELYMLKIKRMMGTFD